MGGYFQLGTDWQRAPSTFGRQALSRPNDGSAIKVLHVFKTYLPDSFTGIERVIWEIAEGLAPFGVESHVLSVSETPANGPVKVSHHYSHQAKRDMYVASTGLSLSIFSLYRKLAQTCDIIHFHFPWPMADLMHLLRWPGKPSILTYHSDIVKQRFLFPLYRPLMNRYLDMVDQIVATSPNYVATSPVLHRYASKTSVIPIGIGDRVEPSAADIEKWRARVGSDFFLFIGAFRYYKGLPFLLEAAKMTGLPVVVVGKGDMTVIDRQDLPNVHFVGAVSDTDKEALLSLSRALVLPSHLRAEAFGVVLVEAARAGKPMISCEIGTGTSFVNQHRETGLTVPPADPERLAEAMRALWSDPVTAANMGRNARSRYLHLLQSRDMCESYFRLYEQILEGHGLSPAASSRETY